VGSAAGFSPSDEPPRRRCKRTSRLRHPLDRSLDQRDHISSIPCPGMHVERSKYRYEGPMLHHDNSGVQARMDVDSLRITRGPPLFLSKKLAHRVDECKCDCAAGRCCPCHRVGAEAPVKSLSIDRWSKTHFQTAHKWVDAESERRRQRAFGVRAWRAPNALPGRSLMLSARRPRAAKLEAAFPGCTSVARQSHCTYPRRFGDIAADTLARRRRSER
jgi:hypothetical protein